jgi:hypothetical protein
MILKKPTVSPKSKAVINRETPMATNQTTSGARLLYEQELRLNREWAMDEGDRHFQRDNAVFKSLRKIAKRLGDLGVPYAIAGGMALDAHGFRRLTVDVDILIGRDALKTIHDSLDGLGYIPPFASSKNLRDTEHGVRIEFLIAGEFPGDGKPKPVAFPDPREASVTLDGISYLSLPKLVELKLASGMTNPGRLKDLGDVQELIRILDLPLDFTAELNPFVQDRYVELWNGVKQSPAEP